MRNAAVGVEGAAVEIDVVVQRDGIEPEVGPEAALARLAFDAAALDVVDRGGAERLRRLPAVVARAGGQPNIGCVVGSHGGRDAAVVEQPLVNRQHLVRAGAREHDVDEPLGDDLADLLAILVERAEAGLAGVALGAAARRGEAERHVGVLRVGKDEIPARRIGEDIGKFAIE